MATATITYAVADPDAASATLAYTVAATAPVVDAGADAAVTIGDPFTRTAVEDDGGSAITAREWKVDSGPDQVGNTLSTTVDVVFTPSAVGSYVLRYTATNSVGASSDTMTVTAGVVGLPPPAPLPVAPPEPQDLIVVDPVAQSIVAAAAAKPHIGYQTLSFTEWMWQPATLEASFTIEAFEALHIDVGMLLVTSDRDLAFIVDSVEGTVRRDGETEVRVTAIDPLSSDGDTGWRIIVPDAGQSHDAQVSVRAETAMKHYVAEHFGSGAADAARRLPVPVAIATDLGRGPVGTWRGRYQQHTDYLTLIGGRARLGWRTTWDYTNRQLVFDVVQGQKRPQRLSLGYGTVVEERFMRTIRGLPTVAYVAGQGTGAARTIVTRFDSAVAPSGWARREVFVDARDTNDTATLRQRGDEAVAEAQQPDPVQVEMTDSASFAYRTDWDVGDTLVWEPRSGAAKLVRIVGVTTAVEESLVPSRRAHLDRPWPNLSDVRARSGGTDFE